MSQAHAGRPATATARLAPVPRPVPARCHVRTAPGRSTTPPARLPSARPSGPAHGDRDGRALRGMVVGVGLGAAAWGGIAALVIALLP